MRITLTLTVLVLAGTALVILWRPYKPAQASDFVPDVEEQSPPRTESPKPPEPKKPEKKPEKKQGTKPEPVDSSEGRTVNSTAYCLTGTMASGRKVYDGAVAANAYPIGTKLQILSGPLAGKVVTVEDRHAKGSTGFDIAMPGDCEAARRYGRRTIQVVRL